MNRYMPTSPAVDTTGDVSRKLTRPEHRAPAGEPLASPEYRAEKKTGHSYHQSMSGNPLRCVIVLVTPNQFGPTEYRVGRFGSLEELNQGLCEFEGSRIALRKDMVAKCFGESKIYTDRQDAIRSAEKKYPNNHGIKVLNFGRHFPN